MDAFLPALISAAPQLGVTGVVIVILVLILRVMSQDRTDYRAQLQAVIKRHAEELERLNKDHDTELAELKADLAELRARLDDRDVQLDEALKARRKAEDMLAEERRANRRGRAS